MAAAWQDWTEKHRPQRLKDLVGNGPAIQEMREWAEAWRDGMPEERALVLAGEPGVGKTSAAHALARDMGWGVIEMNASDTRNEEVIRRIAGSGAHNRAFGADGSFSAETKGRQLVILDEADNLFGTTDRGGMKAIQDTIRDTKQPIVLICNDLYELQRKGAALKTLARTIKFTRVRSNSIPKALIGIAQKESLTLEPGVAEAIAERAGGDMRSAVNDLQALAAGRDTIGLPDVEALGKRDTTGDVWAFLPLVFYGRDLNEARKAQWDLDLTPEELVLWMDENLSVFYTDKADLVEGYRWISSADAFLGRRARRQDYGMWSYASELMTLGVMVSKSGRPAGGRPAFPSWLRKQSTSKGIRGTRDSAARKIGAGLHTSPRRVKADVFSYLKALLQDNEDLAAWVAWRYGLEAEELAFLLDDKGTSARIKKLLELSQERHSVPFRATETSAFDAFAEGSEAEDDEEDAPPTRRASSDDEDEDADGDAEEAPREGKPAGKPAAKPAAGGTAPNAKAKDETPGEPAKKPQKKLFDF